MNNEATNPTPVIPATAKPVRTRKATKATAPVKTRKPRTVDPAVQALRDKTNAAIAALKKEQKERAATLKLEKKSAGVLRVIIDKRLPKLTTEDKNKLADVLAGVATPPLPLA